MSFINLSGESGDDSSTRALRGYLVRPSETGPWPGVVMIHEAFGLDNVMRRQAHRLASSGFLTLAVDLYSARGAARCLVSTMRALTSGEGRAFADIESARSWLIASPECSGKVGVIGFCMGGGFALLSAGSGFDAASVNYGQLPRDMENVFEGACPIIASYGIRDRTLKNAANKLRDALERAGVVHDVKEYPSAGHSFLNDAEAGPRVLHPLLRIAGIGPDPVAAADAWTRITAFFNHHLRT